MKSPMPGLNAWRHKIWVTAEAFLRDYRRLGTYEEIAAILGVHPLQVSRQIGEMLGFIEVSTERTIRAVEPLHDRIIDDVCAEMRLSRRELISDRRGTQLNRARIIIAKRLRASGYAVVDICRVLHRTDTTIQLYWNKNLRLRRSKARRLLYISKRDGVAREKVAA